MKSYRVYWLNAHHRIIRGDWLDALDDEDARSQAHGLCDEETSSVEVWEAARPVGEVECHPND